MQLSFDIDDSSPKPVRLPLSQGDVTYTPQWISGKQADDYFRLLQTELQWRQDTIKLFGKPIKIPRLQAWYGEPHCHYGYSGLSLTPMPFTGALKQIKETLEHDLNSVFNCVLCNWYRDGQDSMSLHADDEPELGPRPVIASVTLGAERDFLFRHKSADEKYRLRLEHGSLLVMAGETQQHYLHGINKSKRIAEPRINLTFRHIPRSA